LGGPDLVFQFETPEIQKNTVKKSRTLDTKAKQEEALADFLARVPKCEREWTMTRQKTQLYTVEQILDTFQHLTLRPRFAHPSVPYAGSATTPIATVTAYRDLQLELQKHATKSTQLYNYSLILFYCICCVAREYGASVEDVDQAVKECLPGREQSGIYSRRLRRAAKWAACVIEETESSTGHPSSQLFVLCGPPLETYRIWSERAETKDELINKYASVFSPTFMIAHLGLWSLGQVNEALGTDLSPAEYERRALVFQETETLIKSRLCSREDLTNQMEGIRCLRKQESMAVHLGLPHRLVP
ncbi:hypothetical protein SODALDRAFT_398782, partial [Sodiomyces alkalinus F11]